MFIPYIEIYICKVKALKSEILRSWWKGNHLQFPETNFFRWKKNVSSAFISPTFSNEKYHLSNWRLETLFITSNCGWDLSSDNCWFCHFCWLLFQNASFLAWSNLLFCLKQRAVSQLHARQSCHVSLHELNVHAPMVFSKGTATKGTSQFAVKVTSAAQASRAGAAWLHCILITSQISSIFLLAWIFLF